MRRESLRELVAAVAHLPKQGIVADAHVPEVGSRRVDVSPQWVRAHRQFGSKMTVASVSSPSARENSACGRCSDLPNAKAFHGEGGASGRAACLGRSPPRLPAVSFRRKSLSSALRSRRVRALDGDLSPLGRSPARLRDTTEQGGGSVSTRGPQLMAASSIPGESLPDESQELVELLDSDSPRRHLSPLELDCQFCAGIHGQSQAFVPAAPAGMRKRSEPTRMGPAMPYWRSVLQSRKAEENAIDVQVAAEKALTENARESERILRLLQAFDGTHRA